MRRHQSILIVKKIALKSRPVASNCITRKTWIFLHLGTIIIHAVLFQLFHLSKPGRKLPLALRNDIVHADIWKNTLSKRIKSHVPFCAELLTYSYWLLFSYKLVALEFHWLQDFGSWNGIGYMLYLGSFKVCSHKDQPFKAVK